VLKVAYGLVVKDENDFYIQLAEDGMAAAASAGKLGAFVVDVIPLREFSLFVSYL
jgi:hypothetical protein